MAATEEVIDDLPPLDEPEEVVEDLPPLDEPEEVVEEIVEEVIEEIIEEEVEEEEDDLPPVDEPEEVVEELPPVDEPEEVVEELPPVDEPEEVEEELPPLDEPEEVEEELPPLDEPEETMDESTMEVKPAIPVQDDYVTGNEVVGPEGKMKKRVNVRLEENFKAPQQAPQIKDVNKDAAYENDNKAYGDYEYQGEGHGKVLVKEQADDNEAALTKHDYYMQGYTKRKKDDFGKEKQKNYDYKRAVRQRRMQAPKIVKEVESARPKRAKKVKKEKKKAPKKKKKKTFGTIEHPLRTPRKDGKQLS